MSGKEPVSSEGADPVRDERRGEHSGRGGAVPVAGSPRPSSPSTRFDRETWPQVVEESKRPRSRGRGNHPADCECVRCQSFTPGPNGTALVSMKHGAYSLVEIQGRAAEVADGIAAQLREEQLWRESFRSTVDACAIVLVRLERANAALTQMDDATAEQPLTAYMDRAGDPFAKLRQDAARWANVARGYLNDLGLTPRSLAAIARDTGLARSTRASAALTALSEHVEREHAA